MHLIVDRSAQFAPYALEHGITVALDNVGGITNDASPMLRMLRRIRSSAVGVLLDNARLLYYGRGREEVPRDLEALAPHDAGAFAARSTRIRRYASI